MKPLLTKKSTVYSMTRLIIQLYSRLLTHYPDAKKLYYVIKHEDSNKGQFGYYISNTAYQICELLGKYNCKTLVDLGAGSGVLTSILNHITDYNIRCEGIEIENSLVNVGELIPKSYVRYGDILDPNLNISKFDAIYFWEPFADPKLAEKFVKNLEVITRKGQYIFYLSDRFFTVKLLNESDKFRILKIHEGIRVFKRK
jgi:protein-L-isoaspartate O-methyltransferase